jgi:peptidoglycan/xylan/chitin deacetylase (PgdA/CDA1 family)
VERESGENEGNLATAEWERYLLEMQPAGPIPRPSGPRRIVLSAILTFITLVVAASGAAGLSGAWPKMISGGLQVFQGSAGSAHAPNRHKAPAPNPNPMLNLRQGCVAGAPTPISYAIHDGSYNGQETAPDEVALTFDDGPSLYSSPPIIAYLERTHTPATFFVEGQYARLWPNLLRREWLDGFAIGMHTWNHPSMIRVSYQEREHQFGDTAKAIRDVLGKDACLWFWRPPYGDLNAGVFDQATAHGLTTLDWNDDPRDWSRPGVQAIVNTALSEATPGGIILFHDGPALRDQTAAALPLILEGLKQRGLRPVTIPQLLADAHYPGVHVLDGIAGPQWPIGDPPEPFKSELQRLRGATSG